MPATRPLGGRSYQSAGRVLVLRRWLRIDSASWPAFPVIASVHSNAAGGASVVLGPFGSTTMVALFKTHQAKPRLPRRNPATPRITRTDTVGGKWKGLSRKVIHRVCMTHGKPGWAFLWR